jgi:hypothetical protein
MRVLVVGRSVLPFGPHVGGAELAGYYLAASLADLLATRRARTVLRDTSSLEHHSSAMGMRTFLLSADDPAPASVTRFLSASGDQPAEILESEQVSPWLHQL